MAKITLKSLKQARDNLDEEAKRKNLDTNYLFLTTLKRLDVQIKALSCLEEEMEDGCLVEKEYVKGRKNVYLSPAVEGYNKTAREANSTTTTLIKIIKELEERKEDEDDSF